MRHARSGIASRTKIHLTHQADLGCPVLSEKRFRLTCRANQWLDSARLTHEGADRESSRTRVGMRWTRQRRRAIGFAGKFERALSDRPMCGRTALQPIFARTLPAARRPVERLAEMVADGEVVWFWRPDAGVKSCGDAFARPGSRCIIFRKATVANKPVTEEITK